jgi:hypothetical protein
MIAADRDDVRVFDAGNAKRFPRINGADTSNYRHGK